MGGIPSYIQRRLAERKAENNFRSLTVITGKVDFTSNDYLGLAHDPVFKSLIDEELKTHPSHTGSTGSRLLSGNTAYAQQLENQIATFHHSQAALLFNSGFDANYGLLSTLPYRGDTILYDEWVHASIIDGIRASKAQGIAYKHNDHQDLEQKLTQATGLKYVVTESLFSMDGDMPDLHHLSLLCQKYDAGLIVDEAHATGIVGTLGAGLVNQLHVEDMCLARIHTFGKALGAHGAVVLCSQDLKDFLINYCRPFIFSTALPFHSLAAIRCAYSYFPSLDSRRKELVELISQFRNQLSNLKNIQLIKGTSPIQSIIISGNEAAKATADKLQLAGYDVRAILYPTVPRGTERIRVCLHSFNTLSEINSFTQELLKLQA